MIRAARFFVVGGFGVLFLILGFVSESTAANETGSKVSMIFKNPNVAPTATPDRFFTNDGWWDSLDEAVQHYTGSGDSRCSPTTAGPAQLYSSGSYSAGIAQREWYKVTMQSESWNANPEPHCVPNDPWDLMIVHDIVVTCPSGYSAKNVRNSVDEVIGGYCEANVKVVVTTEEPVQSCSFISSIFGNPCDAVTGAKLETEVDYDNGRLRFVRYYNSLYLMDDSHMGRGWSHNYSHFISAKPDVEGSGTVPAVAFSPSGYSEPLVEVDSVGGSYAYVSETGSQRTFTREGACFVEHRPDGELWRFCDWDQPLHYAYMYIHYLNSITRPSGEVISLHYDDDQRLSRVVSDYGDELVFTYDNVNRIASISDNNDLDQDGLAERIIYQYEQVDGFSASKLVSVQNRDGKTRQYLHTDAAHPFHLTGVIDENGNQFSQFTYNSDGQVTSSQHSGYEQLTFDYSVDNQRTITDSAGNQNQLDLSGNFAPKFKYLSDEYDTLEEVTNAVRQESFLGSAVPVSRLRVDAGSSPLSAIPASTSLNGSSLKSVIPDVNDYARRPASSTDREGNVTSYGYDDFHLTSKTEDVGGVARTTTYQYLDDQTQLKRFVRTPSVVPGFEKTVETKYELPALPRLPTSVTISGYRPDSSTVTPRTISYTYTADGLLSFLDGPLVGDCTPQGTGFVGDCTAFTYYDTDPLNNSLPCTTGGACGRLKSVTNAKGHVTTFDDYRDDGLLLQSTDPNGLVTNYEYDLRGRVLTITQTPPSGTARITSYTYDSVGQVDIVTAPNGLVLDYEWNEAHYLESVTDNLGNQLVYGYDSRGNQNLADSRDPSGQIQQTVSMTYDAFNRLDIVTQGIQAVITDLDFDAVGNLTDTTNNSYTNSNTFDGLNRLGSSINPLQSQASYQYDSSDNVTKVTSPNGAITEYEYDDLGNLLKEDSPDRGVTLYGYDAAGNMTCKADGRISGGSTFCEDVNEATTFVYDNLNRLTDIIYPNDPNKDVTFTFDAWKKGMLQEMDDESGYTWYGVNHFGEIHSQYNYIFDGIDQDEVMIVYYDQDADGDLDSITYPSGRVVTFSRNAIGQIDGITSDMDSVSTTIVSDATYKPFGPVDKITFGNNVIVDRTYDQAYQVDRIEVGTSGSPSSIVDWDYGYDPAGNIDDLTEDSVNFIDFDYDPLNRLTKDELFPSSHQQFEYDDNGNRTRHLVGSWGDVPLTYEPASNRLTTRDGIDVTLDAMGNLEADGSGTIMTYDVAGRLETLTNASGHSVSNLYNGKGERAHSRREGTSSVDAIEYFIYAPDGRVLSRVSTELVDDTYGNYTLGVRTITDWIWLDDVPVAQIVETYLTKDLSSRVSSMTQLTYLHTDHLNTPKRGTDDAGVLVWSFSPDAFGVGWESTDVDQDGEHVYVPLRFPGQVYYGIGFFSYNYYRDYDPWTGRYLESDPIGLAGGLNTYGYVGGNPLRFVDPSGLEVYFVCRPLGLGLGLLGGKHCAVFVRDEGSSCSIDDAQFSLQYGGLSFMAQGSVGNDVFDADLDAFNNPGGRNYVYQIAPPKGMTSSSFDQAVRDAGYSYRESMYDPSPGPNSNTAAVRIIEYAGGRVPHVSGAIGQNFGK